MKEQIQAKAQRIRRYEKRKKDYSGKTSPSKKNKIEINVEEVWWNMQENCKIKKKYMHKAKTGIQIYGRI